MTQKRYTEIPKRQKCVNKEEPYIGGAEDIIDDETGLTLDKVAGGALEEREYISGSDNGMGRVVLRKNLVNGVNTLTQSMMSDALGNPVDSVYPKVIGNPTNGNFAKFNADKNIEDAGVAPQV